MHFGRKNLKFFHFSLLVFSCIFCSFINPMRVYVEKTGYLRYMCIVKRYGSGNGYGTGVRLYENWILNRSRPPTPHPKMCAEARTATTLYIWRYKVAAWPNQIRKLTHFHHIFWHLTFRIRRGPLVSTKSHTIHTAPYCCLGFRMFRLACDGGCKNYIPYHTIPHANWPTGDPRSLKGYWTCN